MSEGGLKPLRELSTGHIVVGGTDRVGAVTSGRHDQQAEGPLPSCPQHGLRRVTRRRRALRPDRGAYTCHNITTFLGTF